MSPAIALLGGVLFIYLVATGKAGKIWQDITGVASTPATNQPVKPADPSSGAGTYLPGPTDTVQNPPNTA